MFIQLKTKEFSIIKIDLGLLYQSQSHVHIGISNLGLLQSQSTFVSYFWVKQRNVVCIDEKNIQQQKKIAKVYQSICTTSLNEIIHTFISN